MSNKVTDPTGYDIGVIIGRFQVHKLHEGHQQLIDTVFSKHKKVIIFLGCSPVLNSTRNPLDFTSRKKMLQELYPEAVIFPIEDKALDEVWSKEIDVRIKEVYRKGKVLLYGSRDSFIPHYKGNHDVFEIEQTYYVSGTEIRKLISEDIKSSPDWRAGVIFQAYNRYPISYQTVDIAVLNEKQDQILLAKKPNENKWRFVGGFVDPTDESLENAAKRELHEEAGQAEFGEMSYVGSFRVADWRYRSEMDKIMTTLFKTQYIYGPLEPSDDISEIRWFKISDFVNGNSLRMEELSSNIVQEHLPLMTTLLTQLKNQPTYVNKD